MGCPESLEWVSASGGDVPKHAIRAGVDSGNNVFVARARHAGGIILGKLHQSHNCAYIPYGKDEIVVEDYEILLIGPPASLSWVNGSGGDIPTYAIPGGHENTGETLYIGRVIHEGTVTVGKVHPSHEKCYISYGGDEIGYSDYEILVKNKLGQVLDA